MTDPLESFLASAGLTTASFPAQSNVGKLMRKRGVPVTSELKRIVALPSYRWQDDPCIDMLVLGLNDMLGKPLKPECQRRCGHPKRDPDCGECRRVFTACACGGEGIMSLRPVQAAALQAIHDWGGMLGALRVGAGKTLISFVAGTAVGVDRVLLLLPAKLIDKTKRDFGFLRRHWIPPRRIHLMSYELLARDRGLTELNAFRPQLIIADEAHRLKNTKAACTRRVRRHLTKDNKECLYVDMSGTTTKRSLMDYHHRVNWAIPDGVQPLPRDWPTASQWAEALDEGIPPHARLPPGGLLKLCSDDEITEIAGLQGKEKPLGVVRKAYARRLLTSPGVCGTEDQFDGAMPIQITSCEYDVNAAVIEAFQGLRDRWETPDGHQIDQAASLWRHARELAQGFYYKWDPPPPEEWLQARRIWAATVRRIMKDYKDLDSPLMVARAVDSGRIPWAQEARENWSKIKPTFEPKTTPEWIDDSCLQFTAKWARKNTGIIWVHEVAFGERLSEETGLPYYGAGGKCKGRMIEDEINTCIASVAANSEGRNLQQFHKNLVVSCPPGGSTWEQMLGRQHRDGQMADEITVDLPLVCYEQWNIFRLARYDARYIEDTTRQGQKLNIADIIVQPEEDIADLHANGDPLWSKENASFFERE